MRITPAQWNFVEALKAVQNGFDAWKEKSHNAKWFKRIDGTPIPNDLCVCIAESIAAVPSTTGAATPFDARAEARAILFTRWPHHWGQIRNWDETEREQACDLLTEVLERAAGQAERAGAPELCEIHNFDGSLLCNKPKGHDGDHVHCFAGKAFDVSTWPQRPAERAAGQSKVCGLCGESLEHKCKLENLGGHSIQPEGAK